MFRCIIAYQFLYPQSIIFQSDVFALSVCPTDGVYRGDKLINLKKIASEALQRCKERYVPYHALFTRPSHPSRQSPNQKLSGVAGQQHSLEACEMRQAELCNT